MRIAICQINTTVGAFEANHDKVLSVYASALKEGADLVVFPEMSTTGYPPADLLLIDDFVAQSEKTLQEIVAATTRPIIVGYVRRSGRHLHNSAALGMNGKVVHIYDKILLPTYDVFDEDRYFTPGSEVGIWKVPVGGREHVLGIQICEDLWDEDYTCKVTHLQGQGGAEVVINISASPYHERRLLDRYQVIKKQVEGLGRPFLYCNLVGAQDELIFDGQSLAVAADGGLLAQGKPFQEDLLLVDLPVEKSTRSVVTQSREEEIYQALCLGIRDYFRKTGHQEAVIGLSGGIDSSLVACLAVDALGAQHVHGISMPSRFSSDHSQEDAALLAHNLGIDYRVLPIEKLTTAYEAVLAESFHGAERDVTEENIQARIRGNLLMALSNKFNWLVLSTGNKTELALGYCTLYGDLSGGLAVISDLSKDDVYALSKWVNVSAGVERIPQRCLTKPPSAELAPGQVDPFDYEVVSPLVNALVEEFRTPEELIADGADAQLVHDLYRRIRLNEYKRRQAPPGLRVTPKAFGVGRRIPIVNHYNSGKS
jgi:NAD+ synthase (glutamine-hydrolysing)